MLCEITLASVRLLPSVPPHLYIKLIKFVYPLASMCPLVFLQLLRLGVSAITLVKLIRLLASVHHVYLQCIRENGSIIVLFAAVWLSSYMLSHYVLS